MQFMTIIKGSEHAGAPPQALFDAIDKSIGDAAKAGTLVTFGGLLPTAVGARVRITKGKVSVTDGPFTEAKEVIGGYAVHKVKSRDEAIRLAKEFMDLHVRHWPEWEGECELRQMYDAGDGPEAAK